MAKIDYSLLVIDQLVIHDIPKHKKNETTGGPNYSQSESSITDGMRSFFQDKIKAALNSDQSFKICFVNETESSVPLCINTIWDSSDSFITLSKDIARNLYNYQKGNNAAGILLILKGHINNLPVIIILKLERDNGAQLVLNEDTQTFDVKEVEDLMLTKKTKIFKVALFVQKELSFNDFDGYIMDYQINPKNKKDVSTFFLDFLGCMPYFDPKISTKKFYELTREFIKSIDDQIKQSQYIQDLNSYLRKTKNSINPREFADDYIIDTQDKNRYRQHLIDADFAFETYTKDTSLVNGQINKIIVEFENGISILGSEGVLGDKVLLTEDKAEIRSKIIKIK